MDASTTDWDSHFTNLASHGYGPNAGPGLCMPVAPLRVKLCECGRCGLTLLGETTERLLAELDRGDRMANYPPPVFERRDGRPVCQWCATAPRAVEGLAEVAK